MRIVSPENIPNASDVSLDELTNIYRICLLMVELCDKENGAGLSAVQVGIPSRLFIAKKSKDENYRFFVNCDYIIPSNSKLISSIEGCLSLRQSDKKLLYYEVERFDFVKLTGKELIAEDKVVLKDVLEDVSGFFGILIQHEIDHQNGILISDFGKPVSLW